MKVTNTKYTWKTVVRSFIFTDKSSFALIRFQIFRTESSFDTSSPSVRLKLESNLKFKNIKMNK